MVNNVKFTVSSVIPRIIWQTAKTKDLPDGMAKASHSWRNNNKEFQYSLHDDAECIDFLRNVYPPEVLETYFKLPSGAFRADFWRYCRLYVSGGVYADIDTVCCRPLRSYIKERDQFVVPVGALDKRYLFNGFIACTPGHPILKRIIESICCNISSLQESKVGTEEKIFEKHFLSGRKLDEAALLKAKCFSLVGPLGLGKIVNTVLDRPILEPFQTGYTDIKGAIRVLSFSKRRGITVGLRRVIKPKYDGYISDSSSLGVKHWLSD